MHWMHLIRKKNNCTNTQLHNGKMQILFSSELYKHLAATVLCGIFVLYLTFLTQKGVEITDTKLQKITDKRYCL